MDYVARREEFPALAELFVNSFGGTKEFALSVLENFAGEGNVFTARQDGECTALLCAVLPGAVARMVAPALLCT